MLYLEKTLIANRYPGKRQTRNPSVVHVSLKHIITEASSLATLNLFRATEMRKEQRLKRTNEGK